MSGGLVLDGVAPERPANVTRPALRHVMGGGAPGSEVYVSPPGPSHRPLVRGEPERHPEQDVARVLTGMIGGSCCEATCAAWGGG
ncbi:unspecified product [Leishmania tarentolae]|uniref:Unspecified product n=1 Tax=Leishmania tarentolae TaxID=5689 RepID=A0A640KF70_LEITA|nr:unspecified product [Leishmania tarentolae]